MNLLTLIIIVAAVGFFLYLINDYIPMNLPVKGIINFMVISALLVWLLKVFGVWAQIKGIK